jgi:PKD domain
MAGWKRSSGSALILSMFLMGSLLLCQYHGQVIGHDQTRSDLPIVFNGTLPTLYVYEDNASSGKDLLDLDDLRKYVWDPDGHGLTFDLYNSGILDWWNQPWSVSKDKKTNIISCYPNKSEYPDFDGWDIIEIEVNGPGQDGTWNTDDDVGMISNITLDVLPVNDPPFLIGILNESCIIERNGTVFNIYLENRTTFNGLVKAGDVDYPQSIVLSTEIPSEPEDDFNPVIEASMDGDNIHIVTGIEEKYRAYLDLTDDNESPAQRFTMNFYPNVTIPPVRELIGISIDGENVSSYLSEGYVKLKVAERWEKPFWIISDKTMDTKFIVKEGDLRYLRFDGSMGIFGPVEIGHGGEVFEYHITWNYTVWGIVCSQIFRLVVEVYDINRIPSKPLIEPVGSVQIDQEMTLNYSSSDEDGDDLKFRVSFGDGSDQLTTYARSPIHTYTKAGTFNITVTAMDDYGGSSTAWTEVTVVGREIVIPPPKEQDKDIPWILFALIPLALILGILLFALIRFRKKGEIFEE